jgi:hypothetical protein
VPKNLSVEDAKLDDFLTSHPGGVVYMALGSLGWLKQKDFDEVMGGIAAWCAASSGRAAVSSLSKNAPCLFF